MLVEFSALLFVYGLGVLACAHLLSRRLHPAVLGFLALGWPAWVLIAGWLVLWAAPVAFVLTVAWAGGWLLRRLLP